MSPCNNYVCPTKDASGPAFRHIEIMLFGSNIWIARRVSSFEDAHDPVNHNKKRKWIKRRKYVDWQGHEKGPVINFLPHEISTDFSPYRHLINVIIEEIVPNSKLVTCVNWMKSVDRLISLFYAVNREYALNLKFGQERVRNSRWLNLNFLFDLCSGGRILCFELLEFCLSRFRAFEDRSSKHTSYSPIFDDVFVIKLVREPKQRLHK